MFFLSVTCQHSALSQLTEEPEAAQVKLPWGDKCHCASGTWQGWEGKEREDVLFCSNPASLWAGSAHLVPAHLRIGQPYRKSEK